MSTTSTVKILVWLNLGFFLIALSQVYDLVTQLNDNRLMDWLVTRSEISAIESSSKVHASIPSFDNKIPAIIHQTYKNASIPPEWQQTRNTILDTNSDYEYMFWTDEFSRRFLAAHYAWFLPTYDSYKYPIMRADAIRYFALYHYGGFYIDLDIGVKQSLDPLRKFPTAFYKTSPLGVSNDFMASTPKHPFMLKVINSLQRYDRNWILSYITVMYCTGPLFVSIILQKYNWWRNAGSLEANNTRIYVMRDTATSKHQPLSDFIFHVTGSSWHNGDASFFVMVNEHKFLAAVGISLAVLAAIASVLYAEVQAINLVRAYHMPKRTRHLKMQNAKSV